MLKGIKEKTELLNCLVQSFSTSASPEYMKKWIKGASGTEKTEIQYWKENLAREYKFTLETYKFPGLDKLHLKHLLIICT